MEGSVRKRATMMIDSDDEGDDTLGELPVTKKTRRDPAVEDLADGPPDLIKALTEAGFHPRSGSLPNILSVQQNEFQQSLREHLVRSVHYPRSVDFFVSECEAFFATQENFIKALHPTENALVEDTSTSAMILPQDSLVRLLLNMDEVQPKLMQLILQRLAKASKEDQRAKRLPSDVNLPSLILSQIAWLNRIVDPVLVVDTLLDLLSSTPRSIQKEIISHLPSLVADREQVRVAFALSELLEDNGEAGGNPLTAAVLDALGDLNLPLVDAAELRAKVVKRLTTVPPETIPVLLTFIFKRVDSDEVTGLIRDVRRDFDRAFKALRPERQNQVSADSFTDCLSLSIEALQNAIVRSKALADAWFKEIQGQSEAANHRPLDFMVLLMQHKQSGRRRNVELLLRKKLRSESMTSEFIRSVFQLYSTVLKSFFDQLRAVADSLLLSKDPVVVPYGSALYAEMFDRMDEFHQQEVVEALIQHVCCCAGSAGTGPESPATAALTVLQSLSDTSWERLVRFSALIITLLEFLDYMGLAQIKRVMDLLAKMAYGFSENDIPKKKLATFSAAIQSELLMIVKKQLSNTRVDFQRMGVLGAVALINVLSDPDLVGELTSADVRLTDLSSAADASGRNGVLTGDQRLQLAKNLIDLVHTYTERVPEVSALFMDELASLSLLRDMHPTLHSYLYDSVSDAFQENFVKDEDEQPLDGFDIRLTLQYGLDATEVNNETGIKMVFLNIAPLIIKEASGRKGPPPDKGAVQPSVTTLMSHFRLLRNTIDSLQEASLEDIDALLGCALCLPDEELLAPEVFDALTQPEKDVICRCLFQGINWLIEVVNTFARCKPMRAKVIQRIRDIIQLKEKFFKCLAKNNTFMPPPSVFYGEPIRCRAQTSAAAAKGPKEKKTGKKTGGKKKKRTAKKADGQLDGTTVMNTPNKSVFHSTPLDASRLMATRLDFTASQNVLAGTDGMEAAAAQSTFVIHFRELDLSVFVLLGSALDLNNASSPPSTALQARDLEFLLGDLSAKVEHKLLSSAQPKRFPFQSAASSSDSDAFVMLDLYDPLEVAKRSVSLTKRLCNHLETVSGYFQQLVQLNDGLEDGPDMFTESSQRIARCFRLSFRILNCIFAWHGFQKVSGAALREDGLRALASRIREDSKTADMKEVTASCFAYIEKFSASVPTFASAVDHVQLANTILKSHEESDPEMEDRLVAVAEGYLKRSWTTPERTPEKGLKFTQGIAQLLQIYLIYGTNVLDRVGLMALTALPEVLSSGSDEDGTDSAESESFRTCNKATYPVYFRATFVALVELAKKIPGSAAGEAESARVELGRWDRAVTLLSALLSSVRRTERRAVLIVCLKYGRTFVELFYKTAMPLLDKQFKNFPSEAQELLKKLQSGTRTLQQVCNHAKTSRDSGLAAHVPAVKRTQEQLIYRVRSMLAANGCASAFWLGVLKNKDLKGHEIPSVTDDVSDQSDDGKDSEEDDEEEDEEEEEDGAEAAGGEEEDDDVTVLMDEDSRSREF